MHNAEKKWHEAKWAGSCGYYWKSLYKVHDLYSYAEINKYGSGWRAWLRVGGEYETLIYTKTLKEAKVTIDAAIAKLMPPFADCTPEEKQVIKDVLLAHVTPGRTQCPFKRALVALNLHQ